MFLGKEERFALIILILVLAVILASHIFLSQAEKSSFASEYQNISEEGSLVFFEGVVTAISETKTGGHLIIETDGPTVFFAEGNAFKDMINEDDRIKFTGIVSVYNGKKEIIVENIRDIEIFRANI